MSRKLYANTHTVDPQRRCGTAHRDQGVQSESGWLVRAGHIY